jgi:hypothetical protein
MSLASMAGQRIGAAGPGIIPPPMDPIDIAGGLSRFPRRTAGSDSERRASRWLAAVLAASGREAEVETHWVRPHWPLVHALHAGLGVAASVVAVKQPAVGLALALAALASTVLDGTGVAHLVRSLTPARATQNLVSPPTAATRSGRERVVRLVIGAPYDAPRGGVAFAERVRRAVAAAERLARGRIPGPLAWLAVALALVAAAAGARLAGAEGAAVDAPQVVATLGLMTGIAALVDVSLSQSAPGAGEPASGAAVAMALATALDRDPPRRLAVELVLTGGGDLGMREYVRARRGRWRPEATAVLQVAACGRGTPRWWVSDGPLVPLRLHPRLIALAAQAGRGRRRRGHGAGAAWRARLAGWPAIAIGCRTDDAWPPDARRPPDVAERLDPAAMDAALELCLALVRALDEDLADAPR